jgi:WD40 repeat protein
MDFVDVDGNVYSIAVGDEHFYVGKQNAPYIMRFLIQGATENLRFDGHSKTVFTIYWSNNILVSGGADTDVICWNATNGNIIRILSGNTYEVYAVGLFEGFVYSGGENRVVFKWNIDNGDILERFPLIHDTAIKSFANRPSELFTGSIDATVIRWDTISGNMLIQYRGRNKKLRAVATWKTFVMSAGEDIEINIWDASVNSAEPLLNLVGHTQPINTLTIYEDILYSASSDATVLQWDLTNFSLSKMFEGYRDTIISITADQYFVYAAGFARAIYQWNVSSGSISGSFEGHTNDVNCLKLNNNFIFSGSTDRTVRVWDLQLKEAVRVFNGNCLSFFNSW